MSDTSRELAIDMVVQVARGLIDGHLRVIDAARRLRELAVDLDALEDEDFSVFIAIESETDHLPIGPQREEWGSDALLRCDEETRRYEQQERDVAIEAARALIERYQGSPGSGGRASLA